MAEMVKKATRESFGEAITALAETNPDIVVLDADLAEATKTGIFKKKYPERFIDCGIAECNMIGIAAGLATCGKVPFAASFAMFSAGRAFEQVRNSVGYPHLNVKIVGSHAGISVGEDGATHQCCEDIALMRSIPGMVILNPADHYEMLAAVKAAAEHVGPVYIRLGRLAVESFNNNDDYKFEIGKGITLRDGKDITIIATGLMVGEAVKAVKALEAAGIDAASSICTPSSPWIQSWCLRQPRRRAALSPWRSTTSWAAWGRLWPLTSARCIPLPSPRSASTTHSAIPALLWTC